MMNDHRFLSIIKTAESQSRTERENKSGWTYTEWVGDIRYSSRCHSKWQWIQSDSLRLRSHDDDPYLSRWWWSGWWRIESVDVVQCSVAVPTHFAGVCWSRYIREAPCCPPSDVIAIDLEWIRSLALCSCCYGQTHSPKHSITESMVRDSKRSQINFMKKKEFRSNQCVGPKVSSHRFIPNTA